MLVRASYFSYSDPPSPRSQETRRPCLPYVVVLDVCSLQHGLLDCSLFLHELTTLGVLSTCFVLSAGAMVTSKAA